MNIYVFLFVFFVALLRAGNLKFVYMNGSIPGQWLINMLFFLLFLLYGCGLISNQTNSNLQSWMLSWSRWLGGWSLVLTCAILVERPPTASQNQCGMLKYTWTLHITVWSVRNSSRPEMPLQFTIVDIMKERFYLLGPQLINSTFAKKTCCLWIFHSRSELYPGVNGWKKWAGEVEVHGVRLGEWQVQG